MNFLKFLVNYHFPLILYPLIFLPSIFCSCLHSFLLLFLFSYSVFSLFFFQFFLFSSMPFVIFFIFQFFLSVWPIKYTAVFQNVHIGNVNVSYSNCLNNNQISWVSLQLCSVIYMNESLTPTSEALILKFALTVIIFKYRHQRQIFIYFPFTKKILILTVFVVSWPNFRAGAKEQNTILGMRVYCLLLVIAHWNWLMPSYFWQVLYSYCRFTDLSITM